jgi:hypothetical protein
LLSISHTHTLVISSSGDYVDIAVVTAIESVSIVVKKVSEIRNGSEEKHVLVVAYIDKTGEVFLKVGKG